MEQNKTQQSFLFKKLESAIHTFVGLILLIMKHSNSFFLVNRLIVSAQFRSYSQFTLHFCY